MVEAGAKPLGAGAFALVRPGKLQLVRCLPEMAVAVKWALADSGCRNLTSLLQEAALLRSITHIHVIRVRCPCCVAAPGPACIGGRKPREARSSPGREAVNA